MLRRLRLASAALLAACATQPKAPSGPAVPVESPPRPDDPVVTLLDPGQPPRAPLRYRVLKGPQPAMVLDMGMNMAMSMGGRPLPSANVPRIRSITSIDVVSVDERGSAVTQSRVTHLEVLPDPPGGPATSPVVRQRVHDQLQKMLGLTTRMTVTSRGFVREATFEMPAGASEQSASLMQNMRNAVRQIAAVFPTEPVGQGARWRVEATVDATSMKFNQATVFTVDRIEGGRVFLSTSATQTAPAQPFNLPTLPPGASATLISYAGAAGGRLEVSLDSRTPVGTVSVRSRAACTLTLREQRARMGLDFTMDMAIARGTP